MVLRAGLRRLGTPPPAIEARFENIHSLLMLEALMDRVFDVQTWDDLLAADKTNA